VLAFAAGVRNLCALSMSDIIFVGTDSGATTTKFSAVRHTGDAVSTKVLQRSTNSQNGRDAVISGWIAGIGDFLAQNGLAWSQVAGVGLAIPGPYERYGVFGKTPNLPASFSGWDVRADYSAALAQKAGRPLPLVVGNDGNYGGVAEARVRPGRSLCGRRRLGAGRRHARGNGSRPHARAAAIAGRHRQALALRLRARLGLRRGVHHDLRPAAFAGGTTAEISWARTRRIPGPH